MICPLPEVAAVPTKLGAGLPEDAIPMPVAVAKPVAPLKIPVSPRIVKLLENVVGPNNVKSVPVNVSAPPLNEAVKLFDTEDGTNSPEGNITKVNVPASEKIALPKGAKDPGPKVVPGRVKLIGVGTPTINASKVDSNVNGIVPACATPAEPKTSISNGARMLFVALQSLF